MNNNTQWFIYFGFVLGFVLREKFDKDSWEFIFQLIQAVGAIAMPVLLAIWVWYNQKQKEQKQIFEK
ncbi:MAG: hypothetical protein KFW21_04600 [Spirochaetota bacterium]|nr:hypothetical protein [Spirochaetota bacterium]